MKNSDRINWRPAASPIRAICGTAIKVGDVIAYARYGAGRIGIGLVNELWESNPDFGQSWTPMIQIYAPGDRRFPWCCKMRRHSIALTPHKSVALVSDANLVAFHSDEDYIRGVRENLLSS